MKEGGDRWQASRFSVHRLCKLLSPQFFSFLFVTGEGERAHVRGTSGSGAELLTAQTVYVSGIRCRVHVIFHVTYRARNIVISHTVSLLVRRNQQKEKDQATGTKMTETKVREQTLP